MTYKKLSDITGFSISTISKAFSQSHEISTVTREKIYSAARAAGCFDKYYKEKYTKRIIAVICPEFKSRYISTVTETVQHVFKKNDCLTLISVSDFNINTETELIEYYALYAKVDAIMLVMPTIKKIKKYSIPIVAIGGGISDIDSVHISHDGAILDAIKLLKEYGHTRIAFIGEELTKSKEKDFLDAMNKLGISPQKQYIIRSKKRFEDVGREGMEHLLSLPDKPTAVIAAYDHIAIGAIRKIKSSGLLIPDDISIIGMDDIDDAQNTTPALSSIKTYITDVVSLAADIIMRKLENPYFKAIQNTQINAGLINRESVGVCKGAKL